ncbi:Purine nucleoside phosphoramidase [Streptococcus parasanguinis]|uniref:HIT family protein n=1 Tax=Streptococcus parasanguinis TaxID=1318 RepID=UPI00195FFC88|nr:HIT family protein [Streptococcus parasanguinis]VTY17828.1 Purine nucleoside phosphoramidase [Streptococcus parasanguinis]
MVDDCIFCKIVAGDIPSSKVYEDEEVLAFLDISQVTPGHTLVIPKKHARNLLDMDETTTAQLFARVSKVAKKVEVATQAKGMNIISNMEEVSGQTVFHTHVHIIPRYSAQDELAISFTEHEPNFERLAILAETIKNS